MPQCAARNSCTGRSKPCASLLHCLCSEATATQRAAALQRVRSGRAPWYPDPRPSTASSTHPYDIAPSLRVGGALLAPHSIGSMGAGSEAEFLGAPSMDSSSFARPNEVLSAADVAAAVRSGALPLRQSSVDPRGSLPALSGSLYNAFYSGMDVSATPPTSLPRSGASMAGTSVATASKPVDTPPPPPSTRSAAGATGSSAATQQGGERAATPSPLAPVRRRQEGDRDSVTLTMGPRPQQRVSAEHLLCAPPAASLSAQSRCPLTCTHSHKPLSAFVCMSYAGHGLWHIRPAMRSLPCWTFLCSG